MKMIFFCFKIQELMNLHQNIVNKSQEWSDIDFSPQKFQEWETYKILR